MEDAVDCCVEMVDSEVREGGEKELIDDNDGRGWLWKPCENEDGVSGAFRIPPDWFSLGSTWRVYPCNERSGGRV